MTAPDTYLSSPDTSRRSGKIKAGRQPAPDRERSDALDGGVFAHDITRADEPLRLRFYTAYDAAFILPDEMEDLAGFQSCFALNEGEQYEQLAEKEAVAAIRWPAGDVPRRLIFFETNGPVKMSPEGYARDSAHAGLDQIDRLEIRERPGARLMDFAYRQPPLSAHQSAETPPLLSVLGRMRLVPACHDVGREAARVSAG